MASEVALRICMGSRLQSNTKARRKGFMLAAVDLNTTLRGSPELCNSN